MPFAATPEIVELPFRETVPHAKRKFFQINLTIIHKHDYAM